MKVIHEDPTLYNNNDNDNVNNVNITNPLLSDDSNDNIRKNNNYTTDRISNQAYVLTVIDYVKNEKEKKIYHVQGCNPDEFNITVQCGDFQEFCNKMFEYQIDTLCISEINLDTKKL